MVKNAVPRHSSKFKQKAAFWAAFCLNTVDPNDIRILTWSIHFVRNNWRNTSNAKIRVAEGSFPSLSQHLLFQQILKDEVDALMDLVKTPPPKQLVDLDSVEK